MVKGCIGYNILCLSFSIYLVWLDWEFFKICVFNETCEVIDLIKLGMCVIVM